MITTHINTIAFNGLEVLDVDLQVQLTNGLPSFGIVGLPDKTISESKERVKSALESMGLDIPAKRLIINLSPAGLLKEGSHFDLPIAMGVLVVLGVVPVDVLNDYIVLGELGLDGSIISVNGVLPVAIAANSKGKGIICPESCGSEAMWSGLKNVVAAPNLLSLINHFKGSQIIPTPALKKIDGMKKHLDMADVLGQESAKKAFEVAAAGSHNLLMVGPPGSGKSMLAERLPSILPPLTSKEALETSVISSICGELKEGKICFERPFRAPHHSASTPALVGGGRKARPGEISLAHNGVLFLDELPEFARPTLEALRQPLESGIVNVSRVNAFCSYPARFMLVGAMNPCRCGYLGNHKMECKRAPLCAEEYQNKISGPLLDRIDIHIDVMAVKPTELANIKRGEGSKEILNRVIKAREFQAQRYAESGLNISVNAQLKGKDLERFCVLDNDAKALLLSAAERMDLSARAYHRVLRLARTIADLQFRENILKIDIAQALSYRKQRRV
ncbi:MAG: YifB family Mg chelatase-like AAA ATPase [Alphaproteobacteria bacterium]